MRQDDGERARLTDGEHAGDTEGLLLAGNTVRVRVRGYSMYPLFVPGRDWAVIEPVADSVRLRRGDVALYRRESSVLVLHRIWRAGPDGFFFVGDNQTETEGPVARSQIRGILAAVCRDGREFTVSHPVYRICAGVWLMLRPVRPAVSGFFHFFVKKDK